MNTGLSPQEHGLWVPGVPAERTMVSRARDRLYDIASRHRIGILPELTARTGLAVAVVVALGVLGFQLATPQPEPAPVVVAQRVNVEQRIVWHEIQKSADRAKPGTTRSVIDYVLLAQDPYTTGVSPDTLRFRFDAPAVILGVAISVDVRGVGLAEVMASINPESPYGLHARDVLLHTSDASEHPSKIDEQIWFGEQGFEVRAGDFVGVGAWLWNGGPNTEGVTPETIIYYRWL